MAACAVLCFCPRSALRDLRLLRCTCRASPFVPGGVVVRRSLVPTRDHRGCSARGTFTSVHNRLLLIPVVCVSAFSLVIPIHPVLMLLQRRCVLRHPPCIPPPFRRSPYFASPPLSLSFSALTSRCHFSRTRTRHPISVPITDMSSICRRRANVWCSNVTRELDN